MTSPSRASRTACSSSSWTSSSEPSRAATTRCSRRPRAAAKRSRCSAERSRGRPSATSSRRSRSARTELRMRNWRWTVRAAPAVLVAAGAGPGPHPLLFRLALPVAMPHGRRACGLTRLQFASGSTLGTRERVAALLRQARTQARKRRPMLLTLPPNSLPRTRHKRAARPHRSRLRLSRRRCRPLASRGRSRACCPASCRRMAAQK